MKNWQTYIDNVNHFQIKYPDKWKNKLSNNIIIFLSPQENDEDIFLENVNLMLQDLSRESMTLEKYTELTQKQVIDNFGVPAIISLKNTTISEQKTKEFIYDMNYQDRNLKLKQFWFIRDNTAYLFTYTAERSQYDKYDETATQIIQSFTFTQNGSNNH